MVLVLAGSAAAAELPPDPTMVLARFAHEPSVSALQRAAERAAFVEPERVRSWQRRVRAAAALPVLRARVGRGLTDVTRDYASGSTSATASEAWRVEVETAWSLDRLVFDVNELRLARESERLSTRREELLIEVAQLYYARRRLQVDLILEPGARPEVTLDRALAVEELTAILDGLTGGCLTGRSGD
jgi:hypothetical protein